jgi:hypothetical protein
MINRLTIGHICLLLSATAGGFTAAFVSSNVPLVAIVAAIIMVVMWVDGYNRGINKASKMAARLLSVANMSTYEANAIRKPLQFTVRPNDSFLAKLAATTISSCDDPGCLICDAKKQHNAHNGYERV